MKKIIANRIAKKVSDSIRLIQQHPGNDFGEFKKRLNLSIHTLCVDENVRAVRPIGIKGDPLYVIDQKDLSAIHPYIVVILPLPMYTGFKVTVSDIPEKLIPHVLKLPDIYDEGSTNELNLG